MNVDEAVAILKRNDVVALPTETVYGLGARGLDEECVRKIFAVKGRPQDNPVILHVASLDDARPLWREFTSRIEILAKAFWPGPLTIVAPKSHVVPDVVTAGLDKVAVRVPAHPLFIEVVKKLGEPIAAPSANASSRPSPTTASDVLASLTVPVLDGGACKLGIESTVVDVTGVPHVLRLGATRVDEIRAFLPDVVVGGDVAASPGTRHKHYAPLGKRVILVDDPREAPGAAVLECKSDPVEYARTFYANLYRLERSPAETIAIVRVPDGDEWAAVRDRMARAAEH